MSKESTSKIKKLIRNPIFLGTLIGFFAAVSQALLFSAGGPEAYGFCVACHIRDLINDCINLITGKTVLAVAPISKNAVFPILTILGVMIGAFISAKLNKEFKIKTSSIKMYLIYFLGGVLVLIVALLLGGCPYRTALRFGNGDMIAFIGILSMALGVFVGVKIILKRMEKQMGEDK